MKILEVETFGQGGLTHYVDSLARALAARGHEVTIATTTVYEMEGTAPLPAGVKIVKIIGGSPRGDGSTLSPFAHRVTRKVRAIADAFQVARFAARMRPDVVHLHCTNPIAALYLALLRLVRVPIVYTAHVVTPHEPIRFQGPVYGFVNRTPDLVIAHSRFDRDRLTTEFSVAPEKTAVIPHGEYGFFARLGDVPTREGAREELGLDPGDEVALFFGYIREYKGLDLLLEAWPAVSASRPRARLLIAGDPVQLGSARRAQLESWAGDVGALHHFGYVPLEEVTRYFAAADVLVMPYRHISQSGVLLLGLSLGLPVVATRVGALPEMLEDEQSALLIPPEAPLDLGDALIRVLGDGPLRERLSEGSRRVADDHGWPMIAERTERAITRMLSGAAFGE